MAKILIVEGIGHCELGIANWEFGRLALGIGDFFDSHALCPMPHAPCPLPHSSAIHLRLRLLAPLRRLHGNLDAKFASLTGC